MGLSHVVTSDTLQPSSGSIVGAHMDEQQGITVYDEPNEPHQPLLNFSDQSPQKTSPESRSDWQIFKCCYPLLFSACMWVMLHQLWWLPTTLNLFCSHKSTGGKGAILPGARSHKLPLPPSWQSAFATWWSTDSGCPLCAAEGSGAWLCRVPVKILFLFFIFPSALQREYYSLSEEWFMRWCSKGRWL